MLHPRDCVADNRNSVLGYPLVAMLDAYDGDDRIFMSPIGSADILSRRKHYQLTVTLGIYDTVRIPYLIIFPIDGVNDHGQF